MKMLPMLHGVNDFLFIGKNMDGKIDYIFKGVATDRNIRIHQSQYVCQKEKNENVK